MSTTDEVSAMTKNVRKALTLATFLLLGATRAVAADDLKQVESNRAMIKTEAKGILFLAHPTCTLTEAVYKDTTKYRDGSYALTFKFSYRNLNNEPCYRYWDFAFNEAGMITGIVDGDSNAFIPPFFLSDLALDTLKEQIRKDPKLMNDPIAKQILVVRDARQATVLMLRLCQ
jgi:hypothetical protein